MFDPTVPTRVYVGGRPKWRFPDGTIVPVVAGAAGPPTVQDLRDERGRVATAIDDILNTAREDGERALTDEERTEHDTLAERFETLGVDITRAETSEADAQRYQRQGERQRMAVPNVNRIGTPPPSADRSLDELLWASVDEVPAGEFNRSTGLFTPNPWSARNHVEQVTVRNQEDIVAVAPRLGEFLPEHRGAIRAFQEAVGDMILFGSIISKRPVSPVEAFEVARAHRLLKPRWELALRALDVDTTAEGGNWVPTGIGASLHEKVRAAGKLAPLFARIDLPTNPWKWPIEGADATAYRVAEPTTDTETKVTASTPGTGAATFDAEILGGRILFSRSVEADSVIAILPYARGKLAQAFVDAEEKAILDGDTDGTHQDSDVGASTTDARTAWDGLRKRALANAATAGTNAALSVANLRTMRGTMGKWGLDPMGTVYVIGVSSYYDLIGDTEVTSVEKYGAQATILNGELGRLNGSPLVVSEHVRENLNASGVHDGVTTNRTYALAVNRGEWVMGQRMALDIETDDSIYRETFQRVVVGFMREDFQNIGDASTNDDTAIIYNVAP